VQNYVLFDKETNYFLLGLYFGRKYIKHMKKVAILLALALVVHVSGQEIERVDPPNWWVGMNNARVEFMIYGENTAKLAELKPVSKTLNIVNVERLESENYAFLTVDIPADAKAGNHRVLFLDENGAKVSAFKVDLLKREEGSAQRKGFSSADFIYLITPDRFRNGNPKNDRVQGMLEGPNREFRGGRHGGDIAGVIQSLDYFEDLGVSSLWLNPVLENNMPDYSYHGYAMTDLYEVDARYGTNEEYKELATKAKERGIGLIMDQVANHIGSSHRWMSDLPSSDWVNTWDEYTQTNHMKVSRFDPHGAAVDRKQFTDGWFVPTMPDLNQRNPHLATYLIQNSIWWTEYLGLHGIRMDTWSYPDIDFLAQWTKAVLDEYPNFNIVGEEWVADPSLISYWQRGKVRHDDYESYLPTLMDFPLQTALVKGLNGEASWRSAMTSIYESLANDYMFPDQNNIMIFPDNHDMTRIYPALGNDYTKWKMAMGMFFTMRGTLQFYYGTEILMTHEGDDHGDIRADFPGGWEGDAINAFTGEGLTRQQVEARNWIKDLAKLRRSSCALNMGTMLHYIPLNEIYVYFRDFGDEKVMVVLNRNDDVRNLNLSRFEEGINGRIQGEDLISGEKLILGEELTLAPMDVRIISLK
jgi:glycosidase